MKLPRSMSGWTVAAFGATALVMGVIGLVQPDILLTSLGFEVVPAADRAPGDHTRTFMAASSMASFNMGVYYLLAAVTDWRPFFRFTVVFRLVTTVVFTVLVLTDVAPARFVGVALWEAVGAAATGVALLVERRRATAAVRR
ncbi:hypothetical protein O7632_31005 [Solwaraspora sp. WMMD406]|uniref:hypothetical protein n=1 Tax=Solwaraspora sp. WMMD406 TaxID=3016095 RepID=UPI00241601AA|nr:hypothetical protein [Solwaraspora sp. WMMD406]MDG4768491.1 hypothetical protein [Solwaraspora sp. WMMD406]